MNVVAQECEAWFVNCDKDCAYYEQSLTRIEHEVGLMEDRVKALGRTMTYGINAIVIIGETEEEAQTKADEHVCASPRRRPSVRQAWAPISSERERRSSSA
jgi:alkanesulfonate monooxygenase SsuD/methylene tetrahydromethanopterin reductase-like flavin-dependent oxidoreductase (luciferase family)